MNVPAELLNLIRRGENFLIAAHTSPDGDAIGSAIALSMGLESIGKKTVLYDKDPVPELYKFLPGQEKFINSCSSIVTHQASLILLDCNEPERAGLENVQISHSAVIDHHETINGFGDIKWIEPHAAATGLMVYYLIGELGVRMTRDIATNLYTAIAIDTGTFRYNNTTSEVLKVSAELIDAGVDPASIAVALYETWSERRFRLLIMVLNTLEMADNVAVMHVTKGMFAETGTALEDIESFATIPRRMKNIKAVAFFKEIDGGWKVSLRSRGEVNVAKVALTFNGGGHKNAAGYKIKADLRTAKEALLKTTKAMMHDA